LCKAQARKHGQDEAFQHSLEYARDTNPRLGPITLDPVQIIVSIRLASFPARARKIGRGTIPPVSLRT
jgi:hypothetical protein